MVMCTMLSKHLHMSNIFVPEHYGFRKEISAENAVYKLTDGVFQS